jgi:hypothetical protein
MAEIDRLEGELLFVLGEELFDLSEQRPGLDNENTLGS